MKQKANSNKIWRTWKKEKNKSKRRINRTVLVQAVSILPPRWQQKAW